MDKFSDNLHSAPPGTYVPTTVAALIHTLHLEARGPSSQRSRHPQLAHHPHTSAPCSPTASTAPAFPTCWTTSSPTSPKGWGDTPLEDRKSPASGCIATRIFGF